MCEDRFRIIRDPSHPNVLPAAVQHTAPHHQAQGHELSSSQAHHHVIYHIDAWSSHYTSYYFILLPYLYNIIAYTSGKDGRSTQM